LLKSTEKCARYEHSKFLGVEARVQSKWKISKHMKKNPTNMNRPFLSHTQWANNWQLSNTYPSSNTMSMQTEHFLLNKCSHLWVWFWFKLKLNQKSMDMNITMFVNLKFLMHIFGIKKLWAWYLHSFQNFCFVHSCPKASFLFTSYHVKVLSKFSFFHYGDHKVAM
jgi:hypothetical protein